jgi:O-antigen/teichoic acid export membrane protein
VAAVLKPQAFGALELIWTAINLLGGAVQCGLNNAIQRFYWDKDTQIKQRPVIVSSGLAAQMFFGISIIIFGLFLLFFLYPYIQTQDGLPLT